MLGRRPAVFRLVLQVHDVGVALGIDETVAPMGKLHAVPNHANRHSFHTRDPLGILGVIRGPLEGRANLQRSLTLLQAPDTRTTCESQRVGKWRWRESDPRAPMEDSAP